MNNIFSLDGKVVLLTGASGILGPTFCEALTEYGAKVAALDIDERVHDVFSDNASVKSYVCDVSSSEQVKNVVEMVIQDFGKIDVLHNNAQGKNYPVPFEDYTLDMWHETMKVNVDGAVLCLQEVGKHMIARGEGGSVIQTSSIYGYMAPDFRIYDGCLNPAGKQMSSPAVYTVSKAALNGLTTYIASYWAKHKIRINNIVPGGVEFNQSERFIEQYSSRIPLGRMAKEKDMVGALIFFASDASSYITGQDLFVDGGLHVW